MIDKQRLYMVVRMLVAFRYWQWDDTHRTLVMSLSEY